MDKNMYCDDRKTVESFGNKRFAIEKGTRVGSEDKIIDGEKRYFLFDRSKNEDVDYDVKSYKNFDGKTSAYVRYGDWVAYLSLALGLAGLLGLARKKA